MVILNARLTVQEDCPSLTENYYSYLKRQIPLHYSQGHFNTQFR